MDDNSHLLVIAQREHRFRSILGYEKLVADFQPRTDIAASFRIEGGVRRLTPEVELGLFRIAQEALNNVARHSEAAKVAVRMCFTDTDVQLSVSDDGVGFERGRAGDAALGMIGMTERASLVGGRLDVRTSPGRGTSVQTVVPLPHLAT